MVIYGWDLSHHDWGRGPVDIGVAVADGISFMTHKIGEGRTFTDDRYDDFWQRAKTARVPLVGAYYVNHPGDQITQADRFLSLLDARAPGWRDGPFVLQVDAEKFDYMDRAPNLAEIQAFCGRLVSRTGGRFRPIVYAPRWLYGDGLRGLGYPLWASSYGSNPVTYYRTAYPGDNSTRWVAYSGQTPAILQYGSRTRIGSQNTCDANAFRGTLAQLLALVYPLSKENDDMSAEDVWNADVVPAQGLTPGNDTWQAKAALGYTMGQARQTLLMLLDGTPPSGIAETHSGGVPRIKLYAELAAIRAELAAMATQLAAIRTGVDADDLDETALAQQTAALVLAGLTAPQIAAALLAAWPADQAQETAAEVVEQLGVLLSARATTTEGQAGA